MNLKERIKLEEIESKQLSQSYWKICSEEKEDIKKSECKASEE